MLIDKKLLFFIKCKNTPLTGETSIGRFILEQEADPDCTTPSWGPAMQAFTLVSDDPANGKSGAWNNLAAILLPVGAFFFLRILRKKP